MKSLVHLSKLLIPLHQKNTTLFTRTNLFINYQIRTKDAYDMYAKLSTIVIIGALIDNGYQVR